MNLKIIIPAIIDQPAPATPGFRHSPAVDCPGNVPTDEIFYSFAASVVVYNFVTIKC